MLEKMQEIEECIFSFVGCVMAILLIVSLTFFGAIICYACYKSVASETPEAVEAVDAQGASP